MTKMPGADGLADLVDELDSGRHRLIACRLMGRLLIGGGICRTERRVYLDRLSRKEGQQMGERRIGVGNRPILLPLMPAAASDGLDLHHEIAGIRQAHDQTARLARLDLNRTPVHGSARAHCSRGHGRGLA